MGDAVRDLVIWTMALLFATWACWVTIGDGGWRVVAAAPIWRRAASFVVLLAADLVLAMLRSSPGRADRRALRGSA